MKYMMDGGFMDGNSWSIGESAGDKDKRFYRELEESDSPMIRSMRERIRKRLKAMEKA